MSPDSGDWDGQHWGEATRRAEREAVLTETGKTIAALKAEIERLRDENGLLLAAVHFAHEQGFEWPANPLAFLQKDNAEVRSEFR